MIHIHYRQTGNLLSLLVFGHAGYSDPGKDIVCAGVSALTFTFINFMDELDPEGYERTVRPGEVKIQFEKDGTVEKFILTGYRMMCDHYPGYVEMKEI